jgi:hypothetical protein
MSQKQAWIRCSATATPHTLKISHDPNVLIRSLWMTMPVVQTASSERAGALSQLTLRLMVQAAVSTTNWIIEKFVHSGCQVPQVTIPMIGNKNHTHTHASDTFADHDDESLQCTVTWVNHATPPQKNRHQWCGQINLLPHQRNTK